MIELDRDTLRFRFPGVHTDACLDMEFQRTLRIPDDNREYPLPPGLGRFPLRDVDGYPDRVATAWGEHGGVFLPMYQSEALWIRFSAPRGYPFAVKVAAGKVDALTGEPWRAELHADPQDYLVAPDQPWLDGFCVAPGLIRQFVAMPLGRGFTAEEQITGKGEHGGLQLLVHPMRAERYRALRSERAAGYARLEECLHCLDADMGLAPGGLMRQKIYPDDHGIEAWDTAHGARCFVHILNSLQFLSVTGSAPPAKPPTAADYTEAGLPWFDLYDADHKALAGSKALAGLDSVAAKAVKLGTKPPAGNEPVNPGVVVALKKPGPANVREGSF